MAVLRWVSVIGLLCAWSGAAIAQHGHVGHEEAAIEAPKTYTECVRRVVTGTGDVGRAISAGDGADAGAAAYAVSVTAKSMGRLALMDPSVAREKVKETNLLGKAIAAAAQEVHEAAESGTLDDARNHFAELKTLVGKIGQVTQVKYVCPMHCEGEKTYDSPGICPVCKMALTPMSETPFYAQVTAPGSVAAGKPTDLVVRLIDPTGKPVTALDIVHEHDLHFMAMSEDLSFYAHEHPVRQPDGTFVLHGFTFPFGGRFVVYSDFTPTGAANQVSKSEFNVPDGGVPVHEALKLVEDYDNVGKQGAYEFRVRCNGKEFFAGEDSFLRYGVDLNGEPVKNLEPVMGALGHLVIVSADFKHYVHAHPLDMSGKAPDLSNTPPAGGGHAHHHHADAETIDKARAVMYGNGNASDVVFHVVFPEPGLYRAFAQFKHGGKLMTYAVTIDAKANPAGAGAEGSGAESMQQHDHSRAAPAAGGK